MTFVYEKISESDWAEYGLDAVAEDCKYWATGSDSWAIDRERKMYLRFMRVAGREYPDNTESIYFFYWKGYVLRLKLKPEFEDVDSKVVKKRWSFIPSMGIGRAGVFPKELKLKQRDILEDLKDALPVHDAGKILNKDIQVFTEFEF